MTEWWEILWKRPEMDVTCIAAWSVGRVRGAEGNENYLAACRPRISFNRRDFSQDLLGLAMGRWVEAGPRILNE